MEKTITSFRQMHRLILVFLTYCTFFLFSQTASAQFLRTDSPVPELSACGESGEFTVRVASGVNLCSAALQIDIPQYFVYEAGSVRVDGSPVQENNISESGVTILLVIPQGTPQNEVVITYRVRATCEAISTANLPIADRPAVNYTLTGCGTQPLTGESEAINIVFANLNLTINPQSLQGVVGTTLSRTVTVQNSGLGSVQEFFIDINTEAGLSILSAMPAVINGWTVTETSPGLYRFSGSNLSSGASVSFSQEVQMVSCESANTIFEAYYGCTEKCILSNVNAQATATFNYNNAIRPNLALTVLSNPEVTCYGQDYTQVWRITNNGTGTSANTVLVVGTNNDTGGDYGSTYFINGSFELAANQDFSSGVVPATVDITQTYGNNHGQYYGTTGNTTRQNVQIPELAPGESVYLRFTQHHALPLETFACNSIRYRYHNLSTYYEASYQHAHACGTTQTFSITRNNSRGNTGYFFSGTNLGGVDINTSAPYQADFRNTSFNFPNHGLHAGAYVDMVVSLSPSLAGSVNASDFSLVTSLGEPVVPSNIIEEGNGVFRLRFIYGQAPWTSGALSLDNSRLRFQAQLDCSAGSTAWYTVGAEFYRTSAANVLCADNPVRMQCNTVNLTTHCPGPCPNGGLENGLAALRRVTYGYAAQSPDNQGRPLLPLQSLDPDNLPAGVSTTNFTVGDIIEISQRGRAIVTSSSPVSEWLTGYFAITVPANINAQLVANSGKMVITRGNNVYNIENLPVTLTGNIARLDFSIAALQAAGLPVSFTGFIQGDLLDASLQVRVTNPNAGNGSRSFPAAYYFTHNNQNYMCDIPYTAVGYYGASRVSFWNNAGDNARNLTACNAAPHYTRIDHSISGSTTRNGLFPNEYRQIFRPRKAYFNVPSGLSVNEIRINTYNQGSPNYVLQVPLATPVSGVQGYEYDLEPLLAQAQGTSDYYFDEGFILDISLHVSPTCTAAPTETIQLWISYDGTVHDVERNISHYEATGVLSAVRNLNYNTGAGALSMTAVQQNVQAGTNEAQWLVQVNNASDFRAYNNIWIGKSGGSSDITSVQQVTGLNNLTPIGSVITDTNDDGVFELGNLGSSVTRYYIITGPVTGCNTGDLEITFGHSCTAYPVQVENAACTEGNVNLTYTQVFANLQTSIVSQNPGTARPALCEELPYTILVNNAGQGTAYNLSVSIPLSAAEGLSYVDGSLEITNAYTGTTVNWNPAGDDNINIIGGLLPAIRISVPESIVASLGFGERYQIRFRLRSNGCDFRSGQRIGFYPEGINACGSRVQNTAGIASNRVIIDGAPEVEPVLAVVTETANINLTENATDPLTAIYNFSFTNSGDGVNNLPVDTSYKVNLRLPLNWEFQENPETLFDPSVLQYNPGLSAPGDHVFDFVSNLPVGGAVTLTDAVLEYTGDASQLNCEQDMGIIVASVYNLFTPQVDPSCNTSCQLEQVVLNSEASLALPVIPAPTTDEDTQEFCIAEGKTIADIVINEINVSVRWYDAPQGGNELDLSEVLSTGTYYAFGSLVDAATGCESDDRLEVEVIVSDEVTAEAGSDQSLINTTQFVLEGNEPTAPATGMWTVISAEGTDTANVTIADVSQHNTTVTLPLGASAVLEWTVVNGGCSDADTVAIASATNSIIAEDDDFSGVYVNNEEGNTNVGNVLPDNGNGADTLGPDPAAINNITITVVAEADPVNPGENVPVLDPGTGVVSVPADTPAGTYYITYEICETAILPVRNCDTAVVTVVVAPANKTIAIDDINNTYVNTPVSGSVATNDYDPEGHTQSWTPQLVTTDEHTLVLNADGTYTFTPADDFTGTVIYPYTVCDNFAPQQACDTANLTIEVLPQPEPGQNTVTANNDTAVTEEGQPVNINVVANDFDLEGDNFSVTANTNPSNGNVINNGDGTFTYTPNPGFTGVDTFTYTICDDGIPQACDTATVIVTVLPDNGTNDTVANDDAYNGNQNTPITGNVLDNDYDPEGNDQVVTNYTQTSNGTVVVNPNGTFTYTPNTDYYGTDQFVYTICDNGTPQACDTATVYLTVNVTNTTIAIDDINNTYINTPVSGSVATNDHDPEGHMQSWTPQVVTTDGHTLVLNADGTYTFTPADDFTGTVIYPYTVCDNGVPQACDTANLTIEVLPQPAPGANTVTANNDTAVTEEGQSVNINVVANDFDLEGDNFSVTANTNPSNGNVINNGDGTFTYTPNPGFTGVDTFTYTICDDVTPPACDTATVIVTVLPDNGTNDTVANDDAYNGVQNTPITGNVLDNDYDPEGNDQVVTNYTQPANGTVVVNPNGTFTYTPNTDYAGPDHFVYTICDNGAPQACDTATVYLTVHCILSLDIQASDEIVACSATNEDDYSNWLANQGGARANIGCGPITWTYNLDDTDVTCGNANVRTVTFTATSVGGQSVSTTATFTIVDTTAPVFVEALPADTTVACDAVPVAAVLTVTDNCDTDIAVVYSEVRTDGTCLNSYTLTRTWTATDGCDNEVSYTQILTVADTTAPVITTGTGTLDAALECSDVAGIAAALALVPEATDNCTVTPVLNLVSDITTDDINCPEAYVRVRTWNFTDECGNTSADFVQTITIADTTAPVFVEALPADVTVQCDTVPDAAILTAEDNCDASVDVVYTEVRTEGSCPHSYTLTRTWTAADSCMNQVVHTQIITVADTTAPVFTVEPSNLIVECDGAGNIDDYNNWIASNGGGEATDNCGTVSWSHRIEDTNTICGASGTVIVDFIARDECNNFIYKQVAFIVRDTTAPEMTPADDIIVTCGPNADAQFTAWLNSNGGLTATDVCGNITWSNDFTGLDYACGNTGSTTVTFRATDSCGNYGEGQVSFTVEDVTAPELTLAAQSITVSCDVNTGEALNNWLLSRGGAQASDTCSEVVWTNDFDADTFISTCGQAGVHTVTFTAADACGNEVDTTATFTVVDNNAPILILPAQNLTVACDGNGNTQDIETWLANQGGAVAVDSCSSLIWTNNFSEITTTCGNAGSATVTFTATDACGNYISTIATFTIVDVTAPVFTTPPTDVVVACDGNGNVTEFNQWLSSNADAAVTDACSDVTWSYTIEDTNTLCGGTKTTTVNFVATDACGNISISQATFTIADTEGPVFVQVPENREVECDGNGNTNDLLSWLNNNGGAVANDACSQGLSWSNNFNGLTKLCGNTGQAEVTFTVTDACGNSSAHTAVFRILDTTAPQFTTNLPQDRTIECSEPMPEVAVLSADDLCSTATISFTEDRVDGNCPNSYELVRTWIASDACSNTTEHVQVITVQDTTAPEFVVLPEEEIFIRCEELQLAEPLLATDNCGGVDVQSYDEVVPGGCSDTKYAINRTWIATDLCGNQTSFTQVINVACKIEVYNAVTPNGDGYNDELILEGIECYPGNTVEIYNRWGVLVYETKDYNSNGNTFKGVSNGRATLNADSKLPSGTYYYVIRYTYDIGNGESYPIDQAGYLHLENN